MGLVNENASNNAWPSKSSTKRDPQIVALWASVEGSYRKLYKLYRHLGSEDITGDGWPSTNATEAPARAPQRRLFNPL